MQTQPRTETRPEERREEPLSPARRRPWEPALRTGLKVLSYLVMAAVLVVGIRLRFRTPSALWLDEALTVNIASVPLTELPETLSRDGHPPLYYALLHLWMLVVGDGDRAVRALSGIFGVAALVPMWFAGRRLGGRTTAWIGVLLLATSPFALRYSTETRMYSLLVLLSLLGVLTLMRVLERPRPVRLLLLALVTGALLLTHYWSFYLVAVTGLMLCGLLPRARTRRSALAALGAMVAGAGLFLPWLPVFLFQAEHTGTPWAVPGTYSAVAAAVSAFAGGLNNSGVGLSLIFFAMTGLAVFGRRTPAGDIQVDLRMEPVSRALAIVCFGTLTLAITAGLYLGSAYSSRYASVVVGIFLLLVAKGLTLFGRRPVTYGLVLAAVLFGIVGGQRENGMLRTQAPQVAAVIGERAEPGDVVVYCPDQLGPASERLLGERYRHIAFPEGGDGEFVDWVDYAERNDDADTWAFAESVVERADDADIWVVSAPNYLTYERKCNWLLDAFERLRGVQRSRLNQRFHFYEPMSVDQFPARIRSPHPGVQ